ncbi:MAG: response regulator [Chloroflexi bacterium]|nr:MAG: response regulator [Chloroflexota bacterium]
MAKILIVEDDRSTTGLLQTLFEIEGYQTALCPDPDRVLTVAREAAPDLILMDYHLAEQESLPLLRALKADADLKAIPVLMVSGLNHSIECERAGASGFILKPFRPADLLAEVKRLLDG